MSSTEEDEELKHYNQALIEQFRANGGEAPDLPPVLLLTTIGAKSGRPHTTPLGYSTDGDRIIVIAACLGAPKHPAWYYNLVAHPEVSVELGRERFLYAQSPLRGRSVSACSTSTLNRHRGTWSTKRRPPASFQSWFWSDLAEIPDARFL
jgi:deazaflavin-dependent oxidoreductase (nitroreductase family)